MPGAVFILSKPIEEGANDFNSYVYDKESDSRLNTSVIFVEDGVFQQDRHEENMYIIQEDAEIRRIKSSLKPISYRDLLGLVFSADTVIVM